MAELGEGLAVQDLGYLGALHFGDQADCLAGWLASGRAQRAASPPSQASGGRFPGGRAAFVQKHVHRKLQGSVARLAEEELWRLGQLPFAEQFAELERLRKGGRPGTQRGSLNSNQAIAYNSI